MNAEQSQTQILEEIKTLSVATLLQVADFIAFIRQPLQTMSYDSLAHLESEFEDYEQLYPVE